MPRLGAHMSIAGGLPRAVERGRATGCDALQIFTKSASQWRARPLPAEEIATFRARAEEFDIHPIAAHASYLINLAAPDPTLRDRSIAALTDELDRADALGLLGVVLHPGSYTTGTEADGLRLVTEAIDAIFSTRVAGTKLLLEHTAGQGTNLGHRFEHLATIIDGASARDRLGVCLDTCHLLAAGYDIALEQGYADTFDAFESLIGLDRLHLLHLNDSKFACGSRRDRHDHIGRGWVGLKTFARLLGDPRLAGLPMVLETPKDNRQNPAATTPDPADLRNLQALRDLMG
ncbi:MAG: deoxyribonuclease IV [Vicinamibacterales bacterium]|nr:deoxyribonuclease IV [Acidobacteriota bacterium]MDP7471766.1 deoxyribonuclease IV [Vicinamibacterales bacterium]MDP7671042.1 deoxyribonuclease IV [Vicinamibacterales bacterium]HJO38714.1 deoxyribonuclease IV [Vicinamibacterales bacterium]